MASRSTKKHTFVCSGDFKNASGTFALECKKQEKKSVAGKRKQPSSYENENSLTKDAENRSSKIQKTHNMMNETQKDGTSEKPKKKTIPKAGSAEMPKKKPETKIGSAPQSYTVKEFLNAQEVVLKSKYPDLYKHGLGKWSNVKDKAKIRGLTDVWFDKLLDKSGICKQDFFGLCRMPYSATSTANDSILLFTTVTKSKVPVCVKIFRRITENEVDGLNFEAKLYADVIMPLLLGKHTPCLPASSGVVDCSDLHNMITVESDEMTKFITKLTNLMMPTVKYVYKYSVKKDRAPETVKYNATNSLGMLIMENVMYSINLAQFLTEPPISVGVVTDEILIPIIFQILYTLENFNVLGLRHNDLHTQNLFIQTSTVDTSKEVYCEFEYYDNTRYVPTTYLAVLFDFDRSAIYDSETKFPANTTIQSDYCTQYGQCDGDNSKYDAFTVLCYIYSITKDKHMPRVNKFIESHISNSLLVLKKVLPQKKEYCMLVDVDPENRYKLENAVRNALKGSKKKVNGVNFVTDMKPSDDKSDFFWMSSVKTMLESDLFNVFATKKSTVNKYTLITPTKAYTLI